MKYTLSVLVEDQPGVLTRITNLFSRRGFNIESLVVGPSEKAGISRIIMVIPADNRIVEQLIKQLYKLINIIRVEDLTNVACVERELVLIKVCSFPSTQKAIIDVVSTFRAKIVDFAENSLIIEITGDPGKVAVLEKLLEKFGIVNIVRTGKIALARQAGIDTESLKQTDVSIMNIL